MKCLQLQQKAMLKDVLARCSHLSTTDACRDFLVICGLQEYSGSLRFETTDNFILSIFARLSQVSITNDNLDKSGLVVFLEHIIYLDELLPEDDKDFLKKVIEKLIEEWKTRKSSSYSKRKTDYQSMLDNGRQESLLSIPVKQPIKIDQSVIIKYDLEAQMAKFRQVLYEGAFVFTVGGDFTLLEKYMIERIQQELSLKNSRHNERLELRLYRKVILNSTDIELEFIKQYGLENFTDLFNTQQNPDLVLVIWNYDIPEKFMKSLAQSFWQNIKPAVLQFLVNQSRCFVIIWANVNKRPLQGLDECTPLLTPREFKSSELLPWFRSHLKDVKIEEKQIEKYLHRLEKQGGNLIGTYQEMNYIIQELQQGGSSSALWMT